MKPKLKDYSLFAISFIGLHKAAVGEVVYTDIDPDTILDLPGETYLLDIDNDGLNGIEFFNSSFSFYNSTPWMSYWYVQDLIANIQNTASSIACLVEFYSGYASSPLYYPRAFDQFDLIKDRADFKNCEYGILGLRTYFDNGAGLNQCEYAQWYSPYISETIDKFIAVKFFDAFENTHYGWIRCDVKDQGRTLIIKDYAYESIPGHSILAGDTVETVGVDDLNNFNVSIFAMDHVLYLQFNDYPKSDSKLCIYSMNGQLVYSNSALNQDNVIHLNVGTGMFLVKIFNEGISIGKKVILN